MMEALSSSQSFGALIMMKSTLLLGLVFLAGLLFRKASASARHFLWTLAFAALLTLPVLAYTSQTNDSWQIAIPVLAEPESTPAPADESVRPPPRRSQEIPSSSPRGASPATPMRASTWSIGPVLWLFGSALFLLRLGSGIAASRRARRSAREIEDEKWLDLLGDAQARLGIDRSVTLLQSATAELPMTIGLFRPSIVLPKNAERYQTARRVSVLLHELAHVRRRDCSTQLLSQLACAVFWWHPMAWIGAKQMRELSERASDDLVLDAGARASEYAHDLLDMARGLNLKGGAAPIASVTMAHRSRLEERLLAILDPGMARRALTSRFALPTSLFALGVLVSIALATPTVAVSVPSAEAIEARHQPTEPEPAQEAPQAEPEPEPEQEPEQETLTPAQEKARIALVEALNDPEASVREQALQALVHLRDERAVPYLIEALDSANADEREEAAWGLGQMRREDAAERLIGALSDESDGVREQAAWSLGMIRNDAAVPALGRVVTSDGDSNVREQAAWALGMIRSDAGIDSLATAVSDENGNVREQAAWALGMIRDARALPALAKALGDENANVREQAIWAVGMLRSRDSLDVLVAALSDDNANVRSQAAWALGTLGDSRAVDALTAALQDDDADVREQAAWAIGRIAKGDDHDVDMDMDLDMDLDMDMDMDMDMEMEMDMEIDADPEPDRDPDPRGAVF